MYIKWRNEIDFTYSKGRLLYNTAGWWGLLLMVLFGRFQEHFDYYGQDPTLGPLILSLKEEVTENEGETIRCVLR